MSRLLLLALAPLAPAAASLQGSSLSCVPPGVLNDSHVSFYWERVEVLRSSRAVTVEFSRHGGTHRMADRPMGGVLVRPPEERRVSIVDGFRAHLDHAAVLPFPLDARLRSSALSPDLQRAVRSSVLAGESLAARRHTAITLITRVASELRRISALVADACMPSSVHHISGHTNVAFIAAVIDALGWLDVR